MATAGSAKDEMTARLGMIGGMFFKRLIMIFWALAGLLAIGLYMGQLHDPDLIWGYMTRDLLFPGAIGLMLVGILAANMSTLDAGSVSNAALFIKNIYQPLRPSRSERHYLLISKLAIAAILLGGIVVALFIDNLLVLFKYNISIPAIFGASIWLGFVWRRLSKPAVVVQVFVCLVIYALIPNLFQGWSWARTNPAFLQETQPRTVVIKTAALTEDVEEGRARAVGETIEKSHVIEPAGVFFESVARIDPEDPESPKIGIGRFHAEIWVLSWFGIDFSRFQKSQLVAARFFFDALFPFVLLFLLSYLTRPVSRGAVDRFFAKLHTPVQKTPEEERRALEAAYANPRMYDSQKMFPRSNWELLKWKKLDYLGFFGSWVLVGIIIL
jgi:SSS family solute:Na+ symporter